MRVRKALLLLTGIAGGVLMLQAQRPAVRAQAPDDVIAGEWIVTLDENTNTAQAFALAQAAGGRAGHVYTSVLNGFQFLGSDAAAAALARNPQVRTIVPNRIVRATADAVPAGIQRIDAHPQAQIGYNGNGTVIAILDTGISAGHPEFTGRINDSLQKNCIVPNTDANDGYGHGTHVAGTSAAGANGAGVIGVASGAMLARVKVLNDSGSGSWASVICGIDHVTANAGVIAVANMSLGGSGSATGCNDGGLHQAICESVAAGVVYTVAAGNSRLNASGQVPAAYDEVITVSAYADYDGEPGGAGGCLLFTGLGKQCDDTFAKFSNYGAGVDVIAPGVNVLSTYLNNGYAYMSGTSMATPHVAGIVALMRQVNSSLNPSEIRDILRATGECPNGAVNAGGGDCSGQGQWSGDPDGIPEPLVNAALAVQGALNAVGGGGGGGGGGTSNTAPMANNVAVTGDEDTTIGWTPSVGDVDNDPLTCSIVSQPAHGTASVASDCSAGTYMPNHNYFGADSFTYGVSDGQASDQGTVSVTVIDVYDPPGTTVHIESLIGSSINNGSTWTAVATAYVFDDSGNAVSGATVTGHWNGQAAGSATCTTAGDGSCAMVLENLRKRDGTATFGVDNVQAGLPYEPADNTVTSIVVSK